MGYFYECGIYVKASIEEALKYYTISADNHDPLACLKVYELLTNTNQDKKIIKLYKSKFNFHAGNIKYHHHYSPHQFSKIQLIDEEQ